MKRFLLLLALCLLLIQNESFALLRAGLKGGVNLAKVEADEGDYNYRMKPGFMAGVMAEIPVSPTGGLAIRTDVLYVQKGAEFTLYNESGKLLTDELVIAPFLVFRLPIPQFTPFLQAGPEFGFNTLAKQERDGSKANIGPYWKDNNVSINLGGGINIPAGPSDLTLDFRYNLGIVDVSTGIGDKKTKTNGIQILLGYNFLKI
ncbi:MAG: porin family protein [Calditrichota bacterium]